MKKDLSIVFTGDINFDDHMTDMWKDGELLSEDILEFLRSADHVAANIEGSFMPSGQLADERASDHSSFTLRQMRRGAADYLCGIGADIWNIILMWSITTSSFRAKAFSTRSGTSSWIPII